MELQRMDTEPQRQRGLLRTFLQTLLPILLVLGVAVSWAQHTRFEAEQRLLARDAETALEHIATHIDLILSNSIQDLFTLARQLQDLVRAEAAEREAIAELFRAHMSAKPLYDQVRLIDAAGRERVRVNASRGGPVNVPVQALQDKSHRPYVREGLALAPGQLYLSTISPNVEWGQLEQPIKPVVRLVLPISTGQGRNLLVINLQLAQVMDLARPARHLSGEVFGLLDAQGRWLYHSEQGWQVMVAEAELPSVANAHPELWRQLAERSAWQQWVPEGLLSLRRLTLGRLNKGVATVAPQNDLWLLSQMPVTGLQPLRWQIWRESLPLLLLFVAVLGGLAWILARKQLELRTAHDELKHHNLLLQTQYETLPMGIVVTDREHRFHAFNRNFLTLWHTPATLRLPQDGERMRRHMWALLQDPHGFRAKIDYLYRHLELEERGEEIELKDGRILRRYSRGLPSPRGGYLGRLWVYEDITDLKAKTRALEQSEHSLAQAQSVAKIGSWSFDTRSGEIQWSREAFNIFGEDPAQGPPALEAHKASIHPDDRLHWERTVGQALQDGRPYIMEFRTRLADGQEKWIEARGEGQLDDQGVVIRLFGTVQDITERHTAEQTMRKLSQALEQTADTLMITDIEGRVEYVNTAFTTVTGFTAAEAMGRKPGELLQSGHQSEDFYRTLWQTLSAGGVFRDVFINRRKDRSLYYEDRTISPLKNTNGEITHFIATGKDITEQVQTQKRLRQLAYHDALTGLPNRALLYERLEQAIVRARRHEQLAAVIFIDLDRFKVINDTLGHEIGDRLLKVVASRLRSGLRETDTVARLGGDEFVILLEELAQVEAVIPLAEQLIAQVAQPIQVDSHQLHTSASLGISMYPRDGETPSSLLKHADAAMYQAKAGGRNTFSFFSEELNRRTLLRLELEKELYRAIRQEEFQLHYQPQVAAEGRRIIGLEALLRWRHPQRGIISPLEFISILEETGQVVEVGHWVLRQVCRQVVAWRRQFGEEVPRVAVNLSARQLMMPDCVERIEAILQETGCLPQALELEITESALMENLDDVQHKLERLHAMGLRLAVDDFGTGYSSLAYLKRFPLQVLKIDKTFVDGLPGDRDDAAITQAILSLGHSLGLQVLAEGVETPAQARYLQDQRCDAMQGYLFHYPLTASAITRLLQQALAGHDVPLSG